jgi:DNA repair photolyase
MPWFMECIGRGAFQVTNPYNRKITRVPATPDAVHTIVFWSKDFGPFLRGGYLEILQQQGYHLFFNFTVNAEDAFLEPHVPPLNERLEQMAELCRRVPAEAVQWRLDPIVHYHGPNGRTTTNLGRVGRIAAAAAACGITRCVSSFMDHYAKIGRRLSDAPGWGFIEPDMPEKVRLILDTAQRLKMRRIGLFLCCEKDVLQALPDESGVQSASCIPSGLLMQLYGGRLSLKADTGQRRSAGCGCRVSRDIGGYDIHPCFHNCRFCYANPAAPPAPEYEPDMERSAGTS